VISDLCKKQIESLSRWPPVVYGGNWCASQSMCQFWLVSNGMKGHVISIRKRYNPTNIFSRLVLMYLVCSCMII
jgi:hypothetical protein